jgi:hypothetical protein
MQQNGYNKQDANNNKLAGIIGSKGGGPKNGAIYNTMTMRQPIQERIQIIQKMGNRNYTINLGVYTSNLARK